jgi:catechol-2,3-dioxygenase
MIEITAVRLEGGNDHQHITHVVWQSASSTGHTSRQALIEWLRVDSTNEAGVVNERGRVPIHVVTPIDAPAYIRTQVDGAWTDDLLALPRF